MGIHHYSDVIMGAVVSQITSVPIVYLTHWGRVTHKCVGKQTIIGSDNDLLPGRRQAIIWTNAGILLVGPIGTNFSEISIKILTFSFTKMRLNVSSAKWRPFCLVLNVLINRLFKRRSMKSSQLRFTGLCEGNSPVASELLAQMASNAGNVSIWWRHHVHFWWSIYWKRVATHKTMPKIMLL